MLSPSGRPRIPIPLSHRHCPIGKVTFAEAYHGIHIVRHHQPHAKERRHAGQCPQEKRQSVAINSVNMSKLSKKLKDNPLTEISILRRRRLRMRGDVEATLSPTLPASWHQQLHYRQSVLTAIRDHLEALATGLRLSYNSRNTSRMDKDKSLERKEREIVRAGSAQTAARRKARIATATIVDAVKQASPTLSPKAEVHASN